MEIWIYIYFVVLSASDGTVIGSRYKSSLAIAYVWGSALNEDYVVKLKWVKYIQT